MSPQRCGWRGEPDCLNPAGLDGKLGHVGWACARQAQPNANEIVTKVGELSGLTVRADQNAGFPS
jgi:hypothetical protein